MTTAISVQATIGGQSLLLSGFQTNSGTYGSVGHAVLETSITQLAASGIKLVSASLNAPGGLEVDISVTEDGGAPTRIFGGEYVSAKWNYDRDHLVIHARDWGGLLVDQKRVLTTTAEGLAAILTPGQSSTAAGINTQNQTVKQLVTAIAQQYGLKPVINIETADDSDVGTTFGNDDTVYTPVPGSLWGVLNQIARATGNEVYVSPNKELVFGPPGGGAPALALTWGINQVPEGAIPVMGLTVTHNPRRNASFRVLVISYDPAKAQLTEGAAYMISGAGFVTATGQTVPPGLWSGGATDQIDAADLDQELPLYTFHIAGLTQAQAQARATAIATDIAKREFVLEATAEVISSIVPMQQLGITGPIDPAFSGNTFYVNAYSHVFKMPRGDGDRTGVVTHITALDLPQAGTGSPVTSKAKGS